MGLADFYRSALDKLKSARFGAIVRQERRREGYVHDNHGKGRSPQNHRSDDLVREIYVRERLSAGWSTANAGGSNIDTPSLASGRKINEGH